MRRTDVLQSLVVVAMLGALGAACVPRTSAPSDPTFPDRWQFPEATASLRRVSIEQTPRREAIAGYHSTNLLLPVSITVFVYNVGGVTSFGSPDDVIRKANALLTQSQFEQERAAIGPRA